MFLAANARKVYFDINKAPVEIQSPPALMLIRGIIDLGVPLSAHRASTLQSFAQMGLNHDFVDGFLFSFCHNKGLL